MPKQKQILRFAQNDKRRAPQDDSEGLSMTARWTFYIRIYGTLHSVGGEFQNRSFGEAAGTEGAVVRFGTPALSRLDRNALFLPRAFCHKEEPS